MQNKPAFLRTLRIIIFVAAIMIPVAELAAQSLGSKNDTALKHVLPFDSIPITQKKKASKDEKTSVWGRYNKEQL